MNHTNFPSVDPFDNYLMFQDDLFHQLFIGHQLDQEHSLEPLFSTPTPTLSAPSPVPASAPALDVSAPVEHEQGRASHENSSCCETNRKSSSSDQRSTGGAKKRKMVKEKAKSKTAVEVERQRRQTMSSLHASLRLLLPTEYIKGKRSMSDHLHEATRYIKDMEARITELRIKRDELKSMKKSGGSSWSSNSCSSTQECVTTVQTCGHGMIEIIATTCDLSVDTSSGKYNEDNQQGNTLSKLLKFLGCRGLSVVNCVSSRVGNGLVHAIQAQVDDERDIDLSLVQKQISNYLQVSSGGYNCRV